MKEEHPLLDILTALQILQEELLRIALYIAMQGPIEFCGEKLECSLSGPKRRISSMLAMAAGQSTVTLMGMTNSDGPPVRDAYPIARTIVEALVNAAYITAEDDSVAERAIRSVKYASWKHYNRKIGSGDFGFEIKTKPELEEPVIREFEEFAGKGMNCWTDLDVPSRIRRVGELSDHWAGIKLLGGYALIYAISSEIIHGSPYGVHYFYNAHVQNKDPQDEKSQVEEFLAGTVHQLERILISVISAHCGYLNTFFSVQKMSAPLAEEGKLYKRLQELSLSKPEDFPPKKMPPRQP